MYKTLKISTYQLPRTYNLACPQAK